MTKIRPLQLALIFLIGFLANIAHAACQSCLIDLALSGLFNAKRDTVPHHDRRGASGSQTSDPNVVQSGSIIPFGFLSKSRLSAISASSSSILSHGQSAVGLGKPIINFRGLDFSVLSFLATRKLLAGAYSKKVNSQTTYTIAVQNSATLRRQHTQHGWKRILFAGESESNPIEENDDTSGELSGNAKDATNEKDVEVMSSSMIIAIGFYKQWISPLLPPACRFLPTCSQYGVQAIEQFGPQKGVILTAWRLARCSPFGGKGYDPPKWPPVSYTYGSY